MTKVFVEQPLALPGSAKNRHGFFGVNCVCFVVIVLFLVGMVVVVVEVVRMVRFLNDWFAKMTSLNGPQWGVGDGEASIVTCSQFMTPKKGVGGTPNTPLSANDN